MFAILFWLLTNNTISLFAWRRDPFHQTVLKTLQEEVQRLNLVNSVDLA